MLYKKYLSPFNYKGIDLYFFAAPPENGFLPMVIVPLPDDKEFNVTLTPALITYNSVRVQVVDRLYTCIYGETKMFQIYAMSEKIEITIHTVLIDPEGNLLIEIQTPDMESHPHRLHTMPHL